MLQPAPISPFQPGLQLYKYQLRQKIGSGSFGEVWLAADQAVGHEYAIKILKPGVPIPERLREAQIGHLLDHNNVVRVHQADVATVAHNDYVIIAMDYMPSGPITTLANPSMYLPLPEAIRLGKDVLRGLEYLHGHDFYHNDIKPENVLIGAQGQGMLTDYGIVGITQGGAPVPSPMFYKVHAAPEVHGTSGITAQTDVFQAGLTLFRIAVGLNDLRQKFSALGEQAYYDAVAQAQLITPSSFPAFIPSRLRRIILKATHPDLGERYGSALEMRRELEKLNCPGFWTVEANGEFVGFNGAYSYRFEQTKKAGNKYDIAAFKCSRKTGRETRFSKFCHSNVTSAAAKREIPKFMKAVVEGL